MDGRDGSGHDEGRVALTSKEERIKEAGLILILKELHERLDRLVFQTYTSGRAMDAATLARAFKGGGGKVEQRIAQVLTTLVRFGRITALGDGRYAARKAA